MTTIMRLVIHDYSAKFAALLKLWYLKWKLIHHIVLFQGVKQVCCSPPFSCNRTDVKKKKKKHAISTG